MCVIFSEKVNWLHEAPPAWMFVKYDGESSSDKVRQCLPYTCFCAGNEKENKYLVSVQIIACTPHQATPHSERQAREAIKKRECFCFYVYAYEYTICFGVPAWCNPNLPFP